MEKKKVSLLELEGNSNIGLYMFANDKFAIIGHEIQEEKKKAIEEVLKVKVYSASVLSTSLIGVFIAGNNDFLLIPQVYDFELEVFKKIAKENSINLLIYDENKNTFGNNICFGDDFIFLNSHYNKEFIEQLKKDTKYEIYTFLNDTYSSAGALCRYVNKKCFISQELGEKDVKGFIKKIGGAGTVNKGSNFISSGIIANKNGLLIGAQSSTVEIQNIVEILDFL